MADEAAALVMHNRDVETDTTSDRSSVLATALERLDEKHPDKASPSAVEETSLAPSSSDLLTCAIRRWEKKHADLAHSLYAPKARRTVKSIENMQLIGPDDTNHSVDENVPPSPAGSRRSPILSLKSKKNPSVIANTQSLDDAAATEALSTGERMASADTCAGSSRSTSPLLSTDRGASGTVQAEGNSKGKRRSTLLAVRNFLVERLEASVHLGDGQSSSSRKGSQPPSKSPSMLSYYLSEPGGTPFDGVFTREFNARVDEKMHADGLSRRQAVTQARTERMIEIHGSPDKALYFLIDKCPNQAEMKILLEALITDGVDLSVKDSDGRSPLHAAVQRGFVHVARVLMENEAATEETDAHGKMAVQLALEERNDEMAALIMRNMTQTTVRSLFECSPDSETGLETGGKPRFNFYDLMTSGDMKGTTAAVLDSLVEPGGIPDEYAFFYSILEADSDGNTPDNPLFIMGSKTNFQKILEREDVSLRTHNSVRMLIHHKWSTYGERAAIRDVVMYFVFVILVSFSLISAGRQRVDIMHEENGTANIQQVDVRVYKTGESIVRAIAEIIVIIAVFLNVYQEVKEMRASGLKEYLKDAYNYLQLATALLILSLVPLRWADVDEQWYVAAIAYILVCLRMLQLISITRVAGIYLQILTRIVVRDITRFAIIFTIFWMTFSGAFFFILVGTVQHVEGGKTGTSLDVAKTVDSYSAVLVSSLRIMIEGGAIFEYIDKGYHFLAVILAMIFLFVVLIVILNILIAQLSDTYAEVKSDAQRTLEQNWGQALRNLEQTDKFKELRSRSYHPFEVIVHPEERLLQWDKPVNQEEARENERKQRHVEQQLAKQEQQLMAIRSQMRSAITMAKNQEVQHEALQQMLREMLRAQLPDLMEEVVHRNTNTVITSVDTTSARSARSIEEKVRKNLIEEVTIMLEAAVNEVVDRVGGMVTIGDEPI